MLFAISFSNLPFNLISRALQTYQDGRNIVDKFWNVKSDSNVVDNLKLFELAKRLEVGGANAATTVNGTTWYLSNTNAATAYGTSGPTAEYAGQTDITPAVPTLKSTALAMTDTPGTAAVTRGGLIGTGNTWFRTFLSPLLAAQTINSGMTFRLELAATESSAAANAYTRTHVYVWRQGTGLVATLIDGTAANCVTATEYGTTGSGRVCVTSATASNVTLQAGDQIAVEVWVQAVTGYTENILYGGSTHVIHSGANTTPMSSFSTSRVVTLQTATDKGTRWFLSNTNAATAHGTTGPTAEYAGQTDITPAVPTLKSTALAMTDTPGTAATTVGGLIGTGNTWYRTFLSPKLAAQSIASGMTFKLDLAATESNAAANAYTRVNVYVWRQGTGWVSTLIDGTAANCVTATEYGTTGSGRTCVTGAGAAATLLDGDQIAVEVWVQAVTGYTENILYGGPQFVIHSTANTNPMSSFATSRTVTLQTAVAATATISAAAGSQITNLDSSDTSKFINDTACSSDGTCAAFKIAPTGGSATVTSIKVSEMGTVAANTTLANPTLIYDTDANYSNGTTGTFGTQAAFAADQTVTFTNAGLVIPVDNIYYFYIRFDLVNGANYPAGGNTIDFQITALTDVVTTITEAGTVPVTLAGSTTVRPKITSYTNSTESALNYSAACTDCGARIGPGAPFRQTVVINGYGFGTDPGLGSRDTATNKVEIIGVATDVIADDGSADTNVSAWTNTAITIRTDSNIATNTDTDFGTNYGGVSALQVTAGSQVTATDLNFYLFPQVTSVTVPTATANAAREYSASDSDGIVTLNGTRFGSSATGGWVRILGCDSTTCSSPTGSAVTNSWDNAAIVVQVPAVISDSVYTGSLIMQQGNGSANKSHTYTTTGFRVLPRITSLSPTSGIIGDPITVNGNHFCQNNGTCPVAFDANNKIVFTSAVNATVFTSWSNTAIVTTVPVGAVDGIVYATSNTYQSNNSSAFSVLTPAPNNPTSLNQFKDASLTSAIAIGETSSSTNTYLAMIMQTDFSGGTLYPQIEYQPVGTAFSCSGGGVCAQAVEGIGKAGPGPVDCSVLANGCAITITPSDNVFHWQARVRHYYGGSSYYSNWVSFGGNGENATDFKIDKVAPIVTFTGGNTCTDAVTLLATNGATISWTLNESGTGQIEYSKNSNLSGSTFTTIAANNTAHSFALNNLDSNTTYYFQVKSVDVAGNIALRPSVSPFCSFTTTNVTQPAKTTKFFVDSFAATLNGGTSTSSSFAVYVPENSVSIKSAFLELNGFSPSSGTNNVAVSVNGQATSTYAVASNSNSFRILYKVDAANINFDPVANTFRFNPSLDTNISSAVLYLTYSFAP